MAWIERLSLGALGAVGVLPVVVMLLFARCVGWSLPFLLDSPFEADIAYLPLVSGAGESIRFSINEVIAHKGVMGG